MIFHDEDYNIVPLCTIEVVLSFKNSSGESQQNMNPNSLEWEDADGTNIPKEKNTSCSIKLPVDQSTNSSTKDEAGPKLLLKQKKDATNTPGKSTTSTWIKVDTMDKSGVKLAILAIIDLKEEISFMSYGTWVLSGKPTLDKAHKTIQECGKSMVECLGVVKSSIDINFWPLEGDFLVMDSKHLQTDLVLGKQLAKLALLLQKSRKVLEQGATAHMQESHPLQIEIGDYTKSPNPSLNHTPIGGIKSAKQLTRESLVKGDSIKLDTTNGMQQAKPIGMEIKTKEKGTIKDTKQVLEPPESTKDIASDINHKGKSKEEVTASTSNISQASTSRSSKKILQRDHQCNKVYQPQYPSSRERKRQPRHV